MLYSSLYNNKKYLVDKQNVMGGKFVSEETMIVLRKRMKKVWIAIGLLFIMNIMLFIVISNYLDISPYRVSIDIMALTFGIIFTIAVCIFILSRE